MLNEDTMKPDFNTTSVKQTLKVGCHSPFVTRELVPVIKKYMNWVQQSIEIRLIISCNHSLKSDNIKSYIKPFPVATHSPRSGYKCLGSNHIDPSTCTLLPTYIAGSFLLWHIPCFPHLECH